MNRKQRRAMAKAAKKQNGLEAEIAEKLTMFDRIPDECSACVEPFDKTNRDMVFSWNVVVRNDEKLVRLYCPKCWDAAQEAVAQVLGENDEDV